MRIIFYSIMWYKFTQSFLNEKDVFLEFIQIEWILKQENEKLFPNNIFYWL